MTEVQLCFIKVLSFCSSYHRSNSNLANYNYDTSAASVAFGAVHGDDESLLFQGEEKEYSVEVQCACQAYFPSQSFTIDKLQSGSQDDQEIGQSVDELCLLQQTN